MIKNNFWLLVKVGLREAFDFRKYKKKKAALTSFITFFVLMGLLYLFLSTFVNFTMFMQVKEYGGNYDSVVIMACGYCALITFSTSIFRAKGIFSGKDYEMLKAMPVKNHSIISAKIFSLYLVEALYSLIILLPNAIIATVFTGNALYLLYGLLLIVLVPCFPIMLAVLISSLLTLLIDNSRFASIINVVAYLALMAAVMAFSILQSSGKLDSAANMFKYINPSLLFFEKALNGKYLYIGFFVLINVVITMFTVVFIARIYDVGHSASSISTKTKKNSEFKYKTSFKALLGFEYKKIFTSKLYLLNSVSGGIASVAVSISLFFTLKSTGEIIDALSEYVYMFALLPMFFSSIAVPSTSTFSFEGNRFWLLKSLPVDSKKIFKAKLFVSISLSLVLSIAGIVLLGICLKANWFDWIVIVTLNLAYLLLCNVVGFALNSKFYRFDWNEEREIFKNSSSVLISTFLGFLCEIILAASLIGLGFVNKWLAFSVSLVIIVIPTYIIYQYMIRNSSRIMADME